MSLIAPQTEIIKPHLWPVDPLRTEVPELWRGLRTAYMLGEHGARDSARSIHGTPGGTTPPVPGISPFGTVLNFNAASSWVVLGASGDLIFPESELRPCSLMFLVRSTDTSKANTGFFFSLDASTPRLYCGLARSSGSVQRMAIYSGSWAYSDTFTLDTNWHTYLFTWNTNGSVRFWLDGKSIGSTTQAISGTAGSPAYLVTNPTLAGSGYNLDGGQMAVAAFWRRILAGSEVRALALDPFLPFRERRKIFSLGAMKEGLDRLVALHTVMSEHLLAVEAAITVGVEHILTTLSAIKTPSELLLAVSSLLNVPSELTSDRLIALRTVMSEHLLAVEAGHRVPSELVGMVSAGHDVPSEALATINVGVFDIPCEHLLSANATFNVPAELLLTILDGRKVPSEHLLTVAPAVLSIACEHLLRVNASHTVWVVYEYIEKGKFRIYFVTLGADDRQRDISLGPDSRTDPTTLGVDERARNVLVGPSSRTNFVTMGNE